VKQYLIDSLLMHVYGDTLDKIIQDLYAQFVDSEDFLLNESPDKEETKETLDKIKLLSDYLYDMIEMRIEYGVTGNTEKGIIYHLDKFKKDNVK
jgi:hypothetical protein